MSIGRNSHALYFLTEFDKAILSIAKGNGTTI
jgi:hypothetical protein